MLASRSRGPTACAFRNAKLMRGPSLTGEFEVGVRIRINERAGPRLGNKFGTVISRGKYLNSLRIVIDGSRTPLTLHRKYLELADEDHPDQ